MTNTKGNNTIEEDMGIIVIPSIGSIQTEDNKTINCKLKRKNKKKKQKSTFQCDICWKEFSTKGNLKAHSQILHIDIKPYKCQYLGCSKSFLFECRLKVHERIHANNKPFICQICKKCFNEKGNLKIHNRIHTGERPFKCTYEECKATFKTKGQLKDHFKTHKNIKFFESKLWTKKNCEIKLNMDCNIKEQTQDISKSIGCEKEYLEALISNNHCKSGMEFEVQPRFNELINSKNKKNESLSNSIIMNSNDSEHQSETLYKSLKKGSVISNFYISDFNDNNYNTYSNIFHFCPFSGNNFSENDNSIIGFGIHNHINANDSLV